MSASSSNAAKRLAKLAESHHERASIEGDASAQFKYGSCLAEGRGVAKNVAAAAGWFRKAAEQDHPEAQFALARHLHLCVDGGGDEALKWYEIAALKGHTGAQLALARCYVNGVGTTPADEEQSAFWYRMLATRGGESAIESPGVQCQLGIFFNTGIGGQRDPEQAEIWFRKAARQGYALAQFNLGMHFFQQDDNEEGVACNIKEAVRWFRKAAEQGHVASQYLMGACLDKGRGVDRDAVQAVSWYRKAAEQGGAVAQARLGDCLKEGRGVAMDVTQAAVWFRRAAEQGECVAQFNLGLCLQEGLGVVQDTKESIVWFSKAAGQGHPDSQLHLSSLLVDGTSELLDVKDWARLLGASAPVVLARYAGDREVARACCGGCGTTAALQTCSRCLVASFCSKECVTIAWPAHKPHCKRWQANC